MSDVYVRLGSEFNVACRAFTAIGVETADLGNVPDALRTILEHTLSQDASPASLDVYLPRIREIIINLLQGLKRKQQKLRQKQAREAGDAAGSAGSARGSGSLLAHSARTSGESADGDAAPTSPPDDSGPSSERDELAPPRTSSLPAVGTAPAQTASPQRNSSPASPPTPTTTAAATTTTTTATPPAGGAPSRSAARSSHQHNPSASPVQPSTAVPAPEATPPYPTEDNPPAIVEPTAPPPQFSVPPPPPTPPTPDALVALQQHSSLERRASRRYSAYQIAKLTKSSSDVLPPVRDPSATPRNRESMDAVRKRSSAMTRSIARSRNNSNNSEPEPARNPNRISEEREPDVPHSVPIPHTLEDRPVPDFPSATMADDGQQKDSAPAAPSGRAPPSPTAAREGAASHAGGGVALTNGAAAQAAGTSRRSSTPSAEPKDLTLFLQLGRSIKKVALSEPDELSITSLRLLFISKFNYNPPSGDDFPEIYLQDPASGVRYELEDLRDVKDRAVLCLNVEVLDEVKRHIDDGIDGLKKLVQGLAGTVESQGLQMTRVAERQEEAAKKIAELSVAPVAMPVADRSALPAAAAAAPPPPRQLTPDETARKLVEVRELRQDLAVLRQVFSTFSDDMQASITAVKSKVAASKQAPVGTAAAAQAQANEGRAYVEKGRAELGADADRLVTKVDDLQDTVEDLRKDVVMRGVRPLPRQLEQVSKDIAKAKTELKKMTEYIKREKPLFRRVWERELLLVCEEQEFFTMQESLINDLEDDLDKASQTFVLVEQCSEQQSKTKASGGVGGAGGGGPIRNASRGFPAIGLLAADDGLNPSDAKDNVLSEVRALQPNHEGRLEAIERAERARQKELEGRIPEFQKELGQFVEENKLKKAGGVEEAERVRMLRDEQARREIWELKRQMEEDEDEEDESSSEESEDDDDDVDGGDEDDGQPATTKADGS